MKSSPRIVYIGPKFEQEFLRQSQAASLSAVCETTQTERNVWIENQIQQKESMIDCAGESVIPPHIKWVELKGKLIQIDKVRCKVPFNDANYRPFQNYGSITVWASCLSDNTFYMPSDQIRIIQSLIQINFDYYDGICSHLNP